MPSLDEERGVIVRALFSPAVARWVHEERPFYAVAMQEGADGLLVTFNVRNTGDLLQWLLSWGRHVRILEPESLKAQLAEEARAVLQVYEPAEALLP